MRRLPTRRERRSWVLVLFLSMAAADALIVAFKTPAGTSSLWGALGGLISLLTIMLVWMRLVGWSIPVIPAPASWPPIPVDERQQAVRDRSFRRAYQAVFLLFLVSAVAAYIFQDDLPGFLRRISELKLLIVALSQIVLLLATLPVIFLAWTEPDESEGKPAEETGAGESSMMGR
jgi:hypothetical protein